MFILAKRPAAIISSRSINPMKSIIPTMPRILKYEGNHLRRRRERRKNKPRSPMVQILSTNDTDISILTSQRNALDLMAAHGIEEKKTTVSTTDMASDTITENTLQDSSPMTLENLCHGLNCRCHSDNETFHCISLVSSCLQTFRFHLFCLVKS